MNNYLWSICFVSSGERLFSEMLSCCSQFFHEFCRVISEVFVSSDPRVAPHVALRVVHAFPHVLSALQVGWLWPAVIVCGCSLFSFALEWPCREGVLHTVLLVIRSQFSSSQVGKFRAAPSSQCSLSPCFPVVLSNMAICFLIFQREL